MSAMPVFVVKAQDDLALPTMWAYHSFCLGAGLKDQAAEVGKAIAEVQAWRDRNPLATKLPDHKHVDAL